MAEQKKTSIKVFYCYAPEDRALLDNLEKHISPMRRLSQVTGWYNRDILAGTDWAREIETRINAASLILLLISPDFIASDYCYSVEMQQALERHESGNAYVIPIIMRPILWEETPISSLQVLPTNGKAVTQWLDLDEALLDVAKGISKIVKMLLSKEILSQQETSLLEQIGRSANHRSTTPPQTPLVPAVPSEKVVPSISEQTHSEEKISEKEQDRDVHYQEVRIINDRYLLQRVIKQGQICTIYQGTDRRLRRTVAIKAVPAAYIHIYKAAIRLTAQFSHPNIVGLYDIISEPETLYLIEEYVEGNDFAALLNMQLTPYEVVDLGSQICQALLYAYLYPIRRVSHGDLTPAAVMRDRKGVVKVNNFALPSDISYFSLWNLTGVATDKGKVGLLSSLRRADNKEKIVADRELPWGQYSDGRQADDTRAVGLLQYQLLSSHATGTLSVEPPPDGRLRFTRGVPPQLCELVARTVARQHPRPINTAEVLYGELRYIADTFEKENPSLISNF